MEGKVSYQPLGNTNVDSRKATQSSPNDRTFCLVLLFAGCCLFCISWIQRRHNRMNEVVIPLMTASRKGDFVYEAVSGFFVQDDPQTDPKTFDVYNSSAAFGRTHRSWAEFRAAIDDFKGSLQSNESVKVIFAARHGQGYHNFAIDQYGKEAWDCYWSKLNGDGQYIWGPDADLTPLGKDQVKVARDAWTRELANGAPFPQFFISSPLSRAADTLRITWMGQQGGQVKPLIRELWRERNGVHTCDKRRTASYIRETFPSFTIEDGFAEEDELWSKDERETEPQMDIRIRRAFDDLFASDSSTYISLTGHSGVVASVLRIAGHQTFSLQTSGMVPVVVRARTSTKCRDPNPGPSEPRHELLELARSERRPEPHNVCGTYHDALKSDAAQMTSYLSHNERAKGICT